MNVSFWLKKGDKYSPSYSHILQTYVWALGSVSKSTWDEIHKMGTRSAEQL
jgi:hypothetical protein